MLPCIRNITRSTSTRKRRYHTRHWSAGLVILALLLLALPTSAASPQPQPPPTPHPPSATCPSGGQCFADVPPTNPFYTFTNRIYMQDLVSGYPCGGTGEPCDPESRPYYRPSNNVTRQQMAKFIDNARRLPSISIDTDTATFPIFARTTVTGGSAVFGSSDNGRGLWGVSVNSTGVGGESTTSFGVRGSSSSSYGVYGYSVSSYGVYGLSPYGQAGHFNGNVQVTGNLTKGGGSFKIDHPLDPENKYLYHSFVESPDMLNVYRGHVILDDKGEAVVQMPEWFDALNRDFDYQLTCIGSFAPVYIAQEIEKNQFRIAGGKPGLKVSWQVTGVRQDPYAKAHRIPVEEEKTGKEKGKYLHPTEWNQPESMGADYDAVKQVNLPDGSKP